MDWLGNDRYPVKPAAFATGIELYRFLRQHHIQRHYGPGLSLLTKTVNWRTIQLTGLVNFIFMTKAVALMIQTFENLDVEKKRRILNAAMEEFSARGYKQTATDDIVARAGISKGALFHYFGSKEELFIYLIDFVMDTYSRDVHKKIDFCEPDIFIRFRQAAKARLAISIAYPALASFWKMARADTSEVAVSHLNKRTTELEPMMQDFLASVDFSKFREGLDIPRTIQVMLWAFGSFSNEVVERAKTSQQPLDWAKEYAEAEEYLNYFQNLFYKEAR